MIKYTIYGNDYYFDYNVFAQRETARLCPEGKIQNLPVLLNQNGNQAEMYDNFIKLIVAVNKGGNLTAKYNGINEIKEIEEDMLLSLSSEQFNDLCSVCFSTISEGSKTEVEGKANNKS